MPTPAILYAAHLNVLRSRADTALERGGFDHLVVPSGTLHYQVFDDRDYPYAVNPQFKAWLPLTRNPGSWLVYTPGQTPRLIYLQPFDYWHVVPEAPNGYWTAHFDIVVIRKPEEAAQHLPQGCRALRDPRRSRRARSTRYAPNNPEAVVNYLEYHRAFKTPYEIAMMREATRRGVRGHRAAERAFRAGASEFGIHLAYCQAAGQDSNELPYGNIVALNEHGAVLHYTELGPPAAEAGAQLPDRRRRQPRRLCQRHHPHVLRPTRSGEFQSLIDAVDAAQQRMCAQVRAGFDYKQLHLDAHLALAAILKDFGVIKVAPEAAVASGVSSAFFPHGIGHGIGLQVHEVAGFAESDRGGTIAEARRPSLPAPDPRAGTGHGRHHRTGHLLHRHAAGETASRTAMPTASTGRASMRSVPTAASASRMTWCAPTANRST